METATHTGVAFQFERQPDPAWIDLLRGHFPKSREEPWPYLTWEPGDPWIPGERWVLYEMLPLWLFMERFEDPETLIDELNGPHPRSEGHFCSDRAWTHTSRRWPKQFQCLCPKHMHTDPETGRTIWSKMEAWRDGPATLITTTQWRLWRETGCVGFPLWIIQGTTGGHPFEFNKYQQEMLRMAEQPDEPPALGDLPYAPFDMRVVRALERHNALLRMGMTLSEYRRRMTHDYEGFKASAEREMRRQWVDHLSTQLADVNDLFIKAGDAGEIDEAAPRTEIDYERLEDAATEHYIETGRILAPQQISTPLMVSMSGSHR